ncbi:MAG: hypothetical protein ACU85V_14980, partial [Gammaproteobacteria bacterium]
MSITAPPGTGSALAAALPAPGGRAWQPGQTVLVRLIGPAGQNSTHLGIGGQRVLAQGTVPFAPGTTFRARVDAISPRVELKVLGPETASAAA